MRHQEVFQGVLAAASLCFFLCFYNLASDAALPTNTVVDGQLIQGGTYANTLGSRTTFENSTGTGLWLKPDQNVRGVEVDAAGKFTNNGGVLYFRAPNQVVRLDGRIDVRGLQDGHGAFLGNGGRVFVDAGYLYQSGNIYAAGMNGGMIQYNVGAATFAGAHLDATGHGGQGGLIIMNSTGPVDIQHGTNMSTSGNSFSNFDANVISIEGGLVNMEGALYADGVQSRGGTLRLVANGQTDLTQPEGAIRNSPLLVQPEADAAVKRLEDLKAAHDGDVYISPNYFQPTSTYPIAYMTANGDNWSWLNATTHTAVPGNDPSDPTPRAGDGGNIIISAQRNITNGGWLSTTGGYDLNLKGGNGGTISFNAGSSIVNTGRIEANGMNGSLISGDGGRLTLTYKDTMLNNGVMSATGAMNYTAGGQGGHGGSVLFDGDQNPTGKGQVVTLGGQGSVNGALGTVTAMDPASSSNLILGIWKKRN